MDGRELLMAYDKVVDSAVLETGLTKIAAAIREKGGTTDALAFPDAMAAAIAAIEAGGGGGGGNSVSGQYIVASDKTIGTSVENAIQIATGLTRVSFFAFALNMLSSAAAKYKMIAGIWVRHNDAYYGRRYGQSSSTATSIYQSNNLSTNAAANYFKDIDGTMQICGVTSASEIVAGDCYDWFAM